MASYMLRLLRNRHDTPTMPDLSLIPCDHASSRYLVQAIENELDHLQMSLELTPRGHIPWDDDMLVAIRFVNQAVVNWKLGKWTGIPRWFAFDLAGILSRTDIMGDVESNLDELTLIFLHQTITHSLQ